MGVVLMPVTCVSATEITEIHTITGVTTPRIVFGRSEKGVFESVFDASFAGIVSTETTPTVKGWIVRSPFVEIDGDRCG